MSTVKTLGWLFGKSYSKSMQKYQNDSAVGKPYGNVFTVNRGTEYEYRQGVYNFFEGTVQIYSESEFASFKFVFKGRLHFLSLSDLKEPLTDRQLIVRAGKFGRDVSLKFRRT